MAPDDASNLSSPLASSPINSTDPTPQRQIAPQTDVPNKSERTKRKSSEFSETRETRRERKRLKREKKEKKAAKAEKDKTALHNVESKDKRRARKEAKRALKASEKKLPDDAELGDVVFASIDWSTSQEQHERALDASPQVDDPAAGQDDIDAKKKRKKRRIHDSAFHPVAIIADLYPLH